MKFLVLFLSFLSCSSQNINLLNLSLCENKINLVSKDDRISNFQKLDLATPYKTLIEQNKIEETQYFLDFGNEMFIKAEFETTDISTKMRVVNNEEILVNSNDQHLYEGNFIMLKDLHKEIAKTAQLDKNLKFVIVWDEETNLDVLKLTFEEVVLGYIGLLENSLDLDICNLTKDEVVQLKNKYPLVFLFRDLKINIPPPSLPIAR